MDTKICRLPFEGRKLEKTEDGREFHRQEVELRKPSLDQLILALERPFYLLLVLLGYIHQSSSLGENQGRGLLLLERLLSILKDLPGLHLLLIGFLLPQ